MKIASLLSAGLACVLLATQSLAATDAAAGWNTELNLAQQAYNQSVDGRARADTILRAALDAARNGSETRTPPAGANLDAATAQAAYSVLSVLYPGRSSSLGAELAESLANVTDTSAAIASGREWGRHVAELVLANQDDTALRDASGFAESIQLSTDPVPTSVAQSEQAPIGPGRYRFSVLAGAVGTNGYVDGSGAAARFNYPGGIVVDGARNVYVSEFNSSTIRKISPDGSVITLAGTSLQKGSQDGSGNAARFNAPRGLAMDGAGNLFVADSENHTIRKISPTGGVTTVAGTAGAAAQLDGSREAARLDHPWYLTLDSAGNLLVTEHNHPKSIRKVAPDGSVTTLAIKSDLPLLYPFQIAAGPAGKLYVSYQNDYDFGDRNFYGVVKLTPNSTGGYDGTALLADTSLGVDPWAYGMGVDAGGNLIVDYNERFLVVYTPAGEFQRRYMSGKANFDTGGEMAVASNGDVFTAPIWGTPGGLVTGGIHAGIFDPAAVGPVILWGPGDSESVVDGAVKFAVSAVGGESLGYQWYFNASAIGGATQATLSLPDVKMADAGKYYVVVSDRNGSDTSNTAQLAVIAQSSPALPTPQPSAPAPASSSSGGGSFDEASALAVLLLLAAAASRRRIFQDGFAANRLLLGFALWFPMRSDDSNIAGMTAPDTKERT